MSAVLLSIMKMATLSFKLMFVSSVLFTAENIYGFRLIQPHELKYEEIDYLRVMFGFTFPDDITPAPFVIYAALDDEGFSLSLDRCRLSPRGLDYLGNTHYTESKYVCMNWNHPFLRKQMSKFRNKDFPDASIKEAKYYCRNPDNSSSPWCYRKIDRMKENCSIPYCYRPTCQFTGPGMEYTGYVKQSIYGPCEPWSLDAPLHLTQDSNLTKSKHYKAQPYCRNPTYDPIGPYCYVYNYHSNGTSQWLKKAYCDIPFCDTYKLAAVMKKKIHLRKSGPFIFCVHGLNDGYFTHYSSIDSKQNHMNISFRLWHPDYLYKQDLRLALSALAIPATGVELVKWGVGFEIVLSNNETGVIVSPYEDSIFIRVPKLMSGRIWKKLIIEWHQGQIYLRFPHAEEGTYLYKFKEETTNRSILGLYNFKFQYFSVLASPGTPVFMRVYSPEPECEQQITTENEFSRYYIFYREIEVRRLDFAVRANAPCYILLRIAPMKSTFPEVMITLNDKTSTHLIMRTFGVSNGEETLEKLQTSDTSGLISLQNWTLFSLRLYGEKIRLSIHSHVGTRYLLDIGHIDFAGLRYYSIASETTAYWTLGCHPDDIIDPMPASGEEARNCSMTSDDSDYRGQISISGSGRTCLPWLSDLVKPADKEFFDSEVYENVNFCRNVIDDYSAFCYVYDAHHESMRRDHCDIPKCVVKPCRIYGTSVGNVENLTTTMSGRRCKRWKKANEKFIKMFKEEKKGDLKKWRLLDINKAHFSCRNPNNDLGGPWCTTRDPEVEYEPCLVPDCDRPCSSYHILHLFGTTHPTIRYIVDMKPKDEEVASTIFLTTNSKHKTYVKPLWRISGFKFWLKRWDEKREAGLKLTVLNENLTTYFQIQLGAENATKLLLLYKRGTDETILIEKLAPYDFYILLAEKWTGYYLTLRPDRFVFGFTDRRDPLFNWDFETLERGFKGHGMDSFYPKYLIFEKMNAGVLAMSFDYQDSFVEIVSQGRTGTYYPMNFWKLPSSVPVEEITYNFRGTGTAVISFYSVISLGPEMKMSIGGGTLLDVILSEMTMNGIFVSLAFGETYKPTITEDQWAEIKLELSEEKVTVFYQGQELTRWTNPRPLLPYYFDIEITGNMVWIINEYPPDMDSPPVNGAWTEWGGWNCTVSCGGGRGYRKRACAAPPPSLFGLPCAGEGFVYGICNTFTCGDITPEVTSIINFRLKHYQFAESLRSGIDSVRLTCYPDILELVQEQTPSYLVYWEKNGQLLSEKKPVNAVQLDSIYSSERFEYFKLLAEPNDTGVYSCSLQSPLVMQRPIKFVSIIVKTKFQYTHVAFRRDKFKFRCNNAIIAALYDNLEQTWFHNGKIVKRYAEKYLPMLNTMEIELETKDTGVWECVIRSKRFHMIWYTNWLHLKVRYRSDFVKYLMEDNNYTKIMFKNFDDPKLVQLAFSLLFVAVFIGTMFVTYMLVLCQRALTKKIRKMYKNLKIRLEIEDDSDTLELKPVHDNIKSEHKQMKKYRHSKEQMKKVLEELKNKKGIEDTSDSIELVPVRINDKSESAKKNKHRYSRIASGPEGENSDFNTSDSDSISSDVSVNQNEFFLSPVVERKGHPTRTSDRKTSIDSVLDKQSPPISQPDWNTSLGPVHDRKSPPTRLSHRKTILGSVPSREGPLTRVSNKKTSLSQVPDKQSPHIRVSDRKTSIPPVPDKQSPYTGLSDWKTSLGPVPDKQSPVSRVSNRKNSLSHVPDKQSPHIRVSDRKTSIPPVPDKQSPYTNLYYWKTSLGPVPDKQSPVSRVSNRKTSLSPVPDKQSPHTRISDRKTSIPPVPDKQSPYTGLYDWKTSLGPVPDKQSPVSHVSNRKTSLSPVPDNQSPHTRISDTAAFPAQVPDRRNFPAHLFGSQNSHAYGSESQTSSAFTSSRQGSPNLRSDSQSFPTSITESQDFVEEISDAQAYYEARRKIKMQQLSKPRHQRQDRIPEIAPRPGERSPQKMWVQHSQVTYDKVDNKTPLKSILKMRGYPKLNLFFRPRRRVSFSDIINTINENYEEAVDLINTSTDLLGQPYRLSNRNVHHICSSCKRKRTFLEGRNKDDEDLDLLTYKGWQSSWNKNTEVCSGSPSSGDTYFCSQSERVKRMTNFSNTEESSSSTSTSCHMCNKRKNIY